MKPQKDNPDLAAFGYLVRERRNAMGLSQEALAAAALGNPDRKSYVSAIENNRLSKVTPNTARKLSAPLGLTRMDVPASLRWPAADGAAPLEERLRALEAQQPPVASSVDDKRIARFVNAKLEEVLQASLKKMYEQKLKDGLQSLQNWTGQPFSLQSLLACYSLSLLYLVVTGSTSFLQGDISIGDVRVYRALDWGSPGVSAVLPYLNILCLVAALGWCWHILRPFGLSPMTTRQTALRLGTAALIAGATCGVVDYLGSRSVSVAIAFAVPCFAAISTFPPKPAVFWGSAGGILAGVLAAISSFLTDETADAFLVSLSEGVIIGAVLGFSACLVASLVQRTMPLLRPSQFAASGAGIAVGSLCCLAGILISSDLGAVSGATPGLFFICWLALPYANALLDYLSLGVSHRLGWYIVTSKAQGGSIVLVLLLDLTLALVFMVLSVVAVGLALAVVSDLFGIETQSVSFLELSVNDPWGQGLWLTIMVLSTTLWTWLHFGLIVAPMAAVVFINQTLERAAARRLENARQQDEVDLTVGGLLFARYALFYLCWFAVAAIPVALVASFPRLVSGIMWVGWRIASGIL